MVRIISIRDIAVNVPPDCSGYWSLEPEYPSCSSSEPLDVQEPTEPAKPVQVGVVAASVRL